LHKSDLKLVCSENLTYKTIFDIKFNFYLNFSDSNRFKISLKLQFKTATVILNLILFAIPKKDNTSMSLGTLLSTTSCQNHTENDMKTG